MIHPREESLTRSKVWRFAAALVVGVAAVAGVSAAIPHRREPVYAGKTLNQWLDDSTGSVNFYSTSTGRTDFDCRPPGTNASKALQAMGREVLPILLEKLNTPDNPLETKFNAWAAYHAPALRFTLPVRERIRALAGLRQLEPLPFSVAERLEELSKSRHPEIAATANFALTNGSDFFIKVWVR